MREGWKEIKLKEICKFKYGKNLPESKRVLGKYPVYGSSGIVSYHKDYLLKGPGIIVGRKGTVGKVQYSKSNFFPIDTTFYIEEDKSLVDLTFLYYRLSTSGLDTMNSDAAVPGLNRTAAINQKIHLPPLPTQRRIASILSAYDDLIENNLKRIKLLEEMAQKTYEEWFVRMKFPGYETAKFDKETGLPEGWKKVKINNIGKVITGKTPSTIKPEYFDGNIPFIKTPDISKYPYVINTNQYLSQKGADIQKNKFLPKNSVVVSCIGTAGEFALVSKLSQTNQQINAVIFNEEVYQFYFYGFSHFLKPLLEQLGSNGATMTNVNKGKFENIKITLPEKRIIKKYHDLVKNNFDIILSLLEQNQRLKEARDILLPRLMTGMIDVDKMEIEL